MVDPKEAIENFFAHNSVTPSIVTARRKTRRLLDHLEKNGYLVVDSDTYADMRKIVDAVYDMPSGDDFVDAILED